MTLCTYIINTYIGNPMDIFLSIYCYKNAELSAG
jgi:hypothetical protein